MSDNSDYKKPHVKLFDLLPEVNQSATSKSILENVFDRFLTKPEFKYVDGYVGQGNSNALLQRQIQEPSPSRQAYQLQPLLRAAIGTVEHLASYKDILNELERYGIDIDRLPVWGNALQFNWAPPIDMDKLIHYRDYFWYDVANPTSQPDYITIKNIGTIAESRIQLYQNTLNEFGEEHTIIAMDASEQSFSISGNVAPVFISGYPFTTDSVTNADFINRWWTTQSSEYDAGTNITKIFRLLSMHFTVMSCLAG